jgi:hypothetical protein
MNAMQRFKVQSCKTFPSHGDVLNVALALGYRKVNRADDDLDSLEVDPVTQADPDEVESVVPMDLGMGLHDVPVT